MARPLPILLAATLAVTNCSCSILGALLNLAVPIGMAKLSFACLPEGTMIDTPDGARAIETLKAGDMVIGFGGTPVKVLQKHGYMEDPTQTFYTVSFADGSAVELCGKHRIGGIPAQELAVQDRVDGNPVVAIEAFDGVVRSYDLLTEDEGYQVDGVPVNSMIEEMATARRRDIEEAR